MLRTCRWVSPPSFFAVPHLTQFFLSSCWLPSFFWLFFMSLHHGNNLTFHTLRFKKIISRKSIDSWRFYVFKVYHMYFKLLSYRKVHQRLPPPIIELCWKCLFPSLLFCFTFRKFTECVLLFLCDGVCVQEVLVEQRTALTDMLQQLLKHKEQREQELQQVLVRKLKHIYKFVGMLQSSTDDGEWNGSLSAMSLNFTNSQQLSRGNRLI